MNESSILFFMILIFLSESILVQVNITSLTRNGVRKHFFDKLHPLAENAFVILKVSNGPGNEASAFVDEFKPASCYEIEFNALYLEYQLFHGFITIQSERDDPISGKAQSYIRTIKF